MRIRKEEEAAILFKRSRGEKIVFAIVFLIFAVYAVSLVFPFLWLIVNSFADKIDYQVNAAIGKPFALPDGIVWDNYAYAFEELSYNGTNIFGMFFNSLWYTAVRVGGAILMSACTGYIISKYRFKVNGVIYALIIFSMTVPTVGTTGAMFKLVDDTLHIYNTPFYVLLRYLTGTGMNFLVMYGFFKNVSWNYAEAAFIDGAGHFRVFVHIMLPQAKMVMLTLAIISGITAWNEYMDVLLYLPDFPTIASGMYGVSRTLPRSGNTPAYYAALVISIIPVLVLFSCFSDTIMKNFSVGGLKG